MRLITGFFLAGWDSTNRSSPPSRSHPEDLPQALLRFLIDPPQSNFGLEYPWIIGNWRWGGPSSLSSGALRLAAPAPPYPRLGLPTPHSPSQEQAPLGESPGQSVRVSLRGPGGRLAGRPGLEGEGTGEGGWRQAAEALQQSSGPCHFASAGTRRRVGDARSAAPPSLRRSWAGASGGRWFRGPRPLSRGPYS